MDGILCRVCLDNGEFLLNIQDEHNGLAIATTLAKHFSDVFEPEPRDVDMICSDCWSKLREFHLFYTAVEQAQVKFKRDLANTKREEKVDNNAVAMEEMPPDSLLEMEIEIKEEFLDPVEECIVGVTPANPLHEPEEIPLNARITVDVDAEEECQASEEDGQASEDSHGMLEQSTTDEDTASRTRRGTRSTIKRPIKQRAKLGGAKRLSISANDDELIKKYIAMYCELSTATTENFAEMEDNNAVAMEAFPSDSLREMEIEIKEESQDPVEECIVTENLANPLREPEEIPWNAKITVGMDAEEKCKETEPAGEENEDTQNCYRWLKDENNLRHHLRRHNDEGKVFTCEECGKQWKNRQALHNHLKNVHSNEMFACELCNKTFKAADYLKKHMGRHGSP